MYRTLRGIDAVKMICVDLDDTLWRGVLAERDDVDGSLIEGWPLGFAEALTICRKRGLILAIVSKNDSARIAELWPQVFGRRLSLDDFAIRKIGWGPKPDALADAIAEANVLPDSVVFIDDNPVERAAVAAALPEVRLLGAPHYDWRRTLLWSAETQVASITAESARRTEIIRTQGVRESKRAAASREDFLGELGLVVELSPVVATTATRFERAIELINKTNQFNTTGRRWTQAEAAGHFARGGVWWTFSASDIYTNYGLIGVIVRSGDTLDQFVMSCRVFGLGIEQAALHGVAQRALEDHASLSAEIVETPKNGPARGVFRDAGWRHEGTTWIGERVGEPPAHIRLSVHALA